MITKGELMDAILNTPQMVVEDRAAFTHWMVSACFALES
jgi:hypothetical protein